MDHVNEHIDKEIMEIRTNCSSTFCHKQECNFHRSITQVSVSTGTFFTLKHILSLHPSFHITTTPNLSLVEFLTYMFSIVSTWAGLSIFSMNPSIFLAKTITAFQTNTVRNVSRNNTRRICSDEADRVAVMEANLVIVEQLLIKMQSRISRL